MIEPNERFTEILKFDRIYPERHFLLPASDGYVVKGESFVVKQFTGTRGYYQNQLQLEIDGHEMVGNLTADEVLRVIMGVRNGSNENCL